MRCRWDWLCPGLHSRWRDGWQMMPMFSLCAPVVGGLAPEFVDGHQLDDSNRRDRPAMFTGPLLAAGTAPSALAHFRASAPWRRSTGTDVFLAHSSPDQALTSSLPTTRRGGRGIEFVFTCKRPRRMHIRESYYFFSQSIFAVCPVEG